MKNSELLKYIAKFLHPFMILFGVYIILNGDVSPGGGFQGGAILATAYLITTFLDEDNKLDLNSLVKLEKYMYLAIIFIASISFFTKGEIFTNFFKDGEAVAMKRLFLVVLNVFIGVKVALGLITIVSTFIEEGK